MATRYIMVRARDKTHARTFGKQHAKLSTMEYSPERVTSVNFDSSAGLAGGVRGWTIGLTRHKTKRYKTGKNKHQLRPKYNR